MAIKRHDEEFAEEKAKAEAVLEEEFRDIDPELLTLDASIDVGDLGSSQSAETESDEVPNNDTESTNEETSPEGGMRICPRCGWDTTMQAPEPSDEDRLNYTTAILGNRRFKKRYSQYNGRLIFTFHERTDAETQMIFRFIREWVTEEQVTSVLDYTNMLRRCQLALTLETIETPEFTFEVEPFEDKRFESYRDFFGFIDKTFGSLNDSLYAKAYQYSWEFGELVNALINDELSGNL